MAHITFTEYQAAKLEVIGGVTYTEDSQFPNQWGMMSKQYATIENGNFYETMDPNTGVVEFWSDKHPESRYYQDYDYKRNPAQEEETTAAEPQADTAPQPETERQPGYGELLCEKIRTTTADFSKLSEYEKFILDRGYEFKTDEELKAGYDRLWKCGHGVLLTENEFVIEAGKYYEAETLKATYAALCGLVEQKKLRAGEVYSYARFGWCLRNPEAVVAYEEGRDKWEVNNCSTVATEEEAKEAINSEWGFESSRVQIIGTPYYDATDYQFIRFDCGHMTWLWKNGNLYQVYAD